MDIITTDLKKEETASFINQPNPYMSTSVNEVFDREQNPKIFIKRKVQSDDG